MKAKLMFLILIVPFVFNGCCLYFNRHRSKPVPQIQEQSPKVEEEKPIPEIKEKPAQQTEEKKPETKEPVYRPRPYNPYHWATCSCGTGCACPKDRRCKGWR
ncbi:MAG TPA: hypothetical protein VJB11_00620 [archaeon]|nr:hypothetical protein [archaeon]